MTVYPTSPNFRKHAANLRAVVSTLTQVERAHKQAIRDRNRPSELAFRKIHLLLLGVYAEARLRKIIDDPTGFNDRERRLIWASRSQDARWVAAVEFAARRHYRVLAHQALEEVIPAIALSRVVTVTELLTNELALTITDRNRLAHGQWVWQLKSASDDKFLQDRHDLDFNFAALNARMRLLDDIGDLVNVLCVSEPTFDRDFVRLMDRITVAKSELDGATYHEIAAQLRQSNQRRGGA